MIDLGSCDKGRHTVRVPKATVVGKAGDGDCDPYHTTITAASGRDGTTK
jgi:hypothetical protein